MKHGKEVRRTSLLRLLRRVRLRWGEMRLLHGRLHAERNLLRLMVLLEGMVGDRLTLLLLLLVLWGSCSLRRGLRLPHDVAAFS